MSGEPKQQDETQLPPPKVAICIPATDTVQTYFAYDLARMMSHTALVSNVEMYILVSTGSLIMKQRERLVQETLDGTQATHLLFLDSDMRFPKDTILRLLARDLPAVCASYTERTAPFRPVAFLSNQDFSERVWPTPEASGLRRIASCGFGVMMLKREVFEKIPKPWFMVGYQKAGGSYLGEDIYFCLQMEANGIPLVLDQDLTKDVAHIGRFEYMPEHTMQYLAQHPELRKQPLIIAPE